MKCLAGCLVVGLLFIGNVKAQTWPDYHLTNDPHSSSYGVEDCDPLNPSKNLYIDPGAVLNAGATELDSICDENQVYLNGGTVYASAIDADDFTWNSGSLYLNGGQHFTTYGLNSGSGKILNVNSGTTVRPVFMSAIPSGNQLNLNGGGMLSVRGDFNASIAGFHYEAGTLQVEGELTGFNKVSTGVPLPPPNNRNLILTGSSAKWDLDERLVLSEYYDYHVESMRVLAGAVVSSRGAAVGEASYSGGRGGFTIEVSGAGSQLNSSVYLGKYCSDNHLTITDGGEVSGYITIGEYGQTPGGTGNNTVTVSGVGSKLNGGISVGTSRTSGNRLAIENGGVVTSGSASIGTSTGCNDNSVRVAGAGSRWDISGSLGIGGQSSDNSLFISNGGVVTSSGVSMRGSGGRTSVGVSGTGSEWHNSGILKIYSGNSRLSISNGGKVILQDGLTSDHNFSIELTDGYLTIGSDFDVSMMTDFMYWRSTLAVEGQLSGLSMLWAGNRLETPSVLGDMTVYGTFAPGNSPADSIVDGGLTIASDGTLEMELGGYALGSEYDRLTVTGPSELHGTLDLIFLNSFSPTNGASFDLFSWEGDVSGSFSNDTNLTALAGGLSWDTSNLYTTGQLRVIPEPTVISLMVVFGSGLWFVRRYFPSV